MKRILITGATDGIGLETAKQLATQGHHLILHGRNQHKLDAVCQSLIAIAPDTSIVTYRADLSDFEELDTLIRSLTADITGIDIIINNAGVLKTASPRTSDGLDVRFVVNTLAPYAITRALLPLLSEQGRIVNLSSAAQAPVDVEAMRGNLIIRDDLQAYAQSKLAITIWSQELAKTLKPKQVIVAVNPGSLLASKMVKEGFGVAGNDLSIGADILVRAALSNEFSDASGKYFDNDAKRFSQPHAEAQNQTKCAQVMRALEELMQIPASNP